MARAMWKGAISFGLVHIPVGIVSASSSEAIDFDWLDKRTMEPVGYKRVNKVSGKEVLKDNIVKGIEYEKGRYIVLSDEEIRIAHPKSTQTIDIFSFVEPDQIPLVNIDTPYYLAPDKRGEKVYGLLRETLTATGKVALANIILHTRQHLAALMPIDSALVLILLRWPSEVRSLDALALGAASIDPELTKAEKDMARRLVDGMTGKWTPGDYKDSFQEKIMALIDKKVREGKIENVEAEVSEEQSRSADIIDLTELLKRSLSGKVGKTPAVKRILKEEKATRQYSPAKKNAEKSSKAPKSEKTKARAK